jgi:hypothetical protein
LNGDPFARHTFSDASLRLAVIYFTPKTANFGRKAIPVMAALILSLKEESERVTVCSKICSPAIQTWNVAAGGVCLPNIHVTRSYPSLI